MESTVAAMMILERLNESMLAWLRGDYEHALTTIRATLTPEAFDSAWQSGRSRSMQEAIAAGTTCAVERA